MSPSRKEGRMRESAPRGRVIRQVKPKEKVYLHLDGKCLGYVELVRVPEGTRAKIGFVFSKEVLIRREDEDERSELQPTQEGT